jgi:polyribonucleotide nucleotidyltransferase
VVGEVYEGTVKSTTAFGAFVEIMPGTEALLHISEMKHARVEKTEDVVQKGQTVRVKLIERDERGRLRLSMKALEPKPEGMPESNGNGAEATGPRGTARASRAATAATARAATVRGATASARAAAAATAAGSAELA